MASILESIKSQVAKAKDEHRAKRKQIETQIAELERALVRLDSDYAMLDNLSGRGRKPGRKAGGSKIEYGGVRNAVLDAIKSSKGIKPAQMIEKTGLSSAQVHNALTGLKKTKEVKVKDGLYTAA